MGWIKKLEYKFDDLYRRKWALTADNWGYFTQKIFPFVVTKLFSRFDHPVFGSVLIRLFRFSGKNHHAEACIVPIYKDLSFKTAKDSFVMPIQKIREAVEQASYRVILNRCICRDSFNCKNYPVDFACLMIGEACRTMVKNGIAREATLEESLAHLQRGSELGLVAICAWTEMESIAKGIPEKDKAKYIEICFCCPCCCNGLVSFKKWNRVPELRKLFKPTGWRAKATEECNGCGACVKICPLEAISINGSGTAVVGDSCIGCGLCSQKCKQNAIIIEETEPMKDILDYFSDVELQING